MKKILFFRAFACLVFLTYSFLQMFAQTTYVFYTESYSYLPITLKINEKYYRLETTGAPVVGSKNCVTVNITGTMVWSAIDCDGDEMSKYQRTVSVKDKRKVVFIKLIGSTKFHKNPPVSTSKKSTDSSVSNRTTKEQNLDPGWSEMGRNAGDALFLLSKNKGWFDDSHRINIDAGYGFPYGGTGLRLKYSSPAVFGLSLGYGYNFDYKQARDNNKFQWNAGVQMHFNKYVALSLYAGPQYFKKPDKSEIGLGAFLEYSHVIYKRLFITGGIGGVMQSETPVNQAKGQFSWHIGLSYNLFCKY